MPEKTNKAREVWEEFRAVAGKVGLLDTILPPVLFLALNSWLGFQVAMLGSLGLVVLIAILRLSRKQSLIYSLAGMASVGLAIALAYLFGRSQGYFLPDLVNSGVVIGLSLVSLITSASRWWRGRVSWPAVGRWIGTGMIAFAPHTLK